MKTEKVPESGNPPRPVSASLFSLPVSLAALGLVSFAAAANRAIPLASFAAIAFALMAAARAWGRASLSRLDVSLSCGESRLFPGDPLTLEAKIFNRKILPVWLRIELGHSGALTPEGSQESGGEANLLPYERITGSWRFRASRRGVYRLGPATLGAGDILGLFSRERPMPYSHEIVVFPRPADIADFDIPFRDNFGIHPSKGILEDPAWYEGTREYHGGKPARNIHWKASARLTVLQEKIFAPTSHQKVFLLLEGEGFIGERDEPGLERALELLAALAVRFTEKGASFAFATDLLVRDFSAVVPLGRGPEHLGMVLELLARCSLERGRKLPSLLRRSGSEGAGFVVASRAPAPDTEERFRALPSARRGRVFFLFSQPAQADIPMDHPYLYFDDILRRDGAP